jgi:hypothetical protein
LSALRLRHRKRLQRVHTRGFSLLLRKPLRPALSALLNPARKVRRRPQQALF